MRKIYIFFVLFLSLFFQKTYATHALGGDLMYELIAPNQYKITLRIYRDCNGIALNNTSTINWTGTCGTGNATATRISSLDITPLCPGLPTACGGGSGTIGIEEHVYTAIITVPAGCNDINFNYTLCCRNHIITTLIDPGNENIFLYTEHVNTAIVNHSPFFNNYPSPIVCVNQPVLYNHGVYDPDGDSLYFFQGNCYEALNDTIEYLAPYNGVTPLTTVNPIILDPYTGAISFTPNIQQVGVMCIVVQEFRNGVLIGETIRDIQFNVIACANVPPLSSGINNQPGIDSLDFMISICQNNQVCFDLSFSDPDVDILNVTWNNEIATGTFTVLNNNTINPTAQFCWSPTAGDIGLNYFSINIEDDACPITASSTYTYTVQVLPNPYTMTMTYDNSVCQTDTSQITLATLPSAADSVYWSPSATLNVLSLNNAEAFPIGMTNYPVAVYFADGCSLFDTANISISPPPSVVANANTTNICNGGTIVLTGSGASSYTWNNGVVDGVAFVPPVGVTNYTVTGTDGNSCQDTASVQIVVNPILNIVSLPSSTVCLGQTVSLSGQGAQTYVWNNGILDGVPFTPPLGTTTYVVTGTDVNGCTSQDSIEVTALAPPMVVGRTDQLAYCFGDSITLNGEGALSYSWNNGVMDSIPFTQAVGTQSYIVTGTDDKGCINSDTVDVTVNPLPIIIPTASSPTVCEGVQVALTASGAISFLWNNGVVDGVAFFPPLGTTTYMVTGIDINGCVDSNTVDVLVNPLPNVIANTISNNICDGFTATLTGSGAQNYVWSNGIADGVAFIPSVGTTTYVVTGTDANGCVNQDSIDLLVNPLPQIFVTASANTNNICEGESLILTASGAQSYAWNNGVLNGVAFEPPVGTNSYIVTGVNANACYNYDTVEVTVNPLPTINISPSANNVCTGSNINLSATGASTYTWSNGILTGIDFTPPVGTSTYYVSATDANNCLNTDSVDIIVNPLPIVVANTNGNNLCDGNTIVLNGSGAQIYTWDNGVMDGVTFTPPVGTTTYNVTGTDSNGCVNQANIDIIVNALPQITIALSPNGNVLCEGESLSLTASGAQNFSWNNGVVNGISFVPPVGTSIYVVTAVDSNACVNSDSLDILVNPLPTINITPSANNVCAGTNINLTATGASTYTWSNGILNGVDFTPPVGTGTYYVSATDANNCINTDSIDIIVNPLPNVVANSSGNNICDGFTVVLFGAGAQTYAWDNGVSDGVSFVPTLGTTLYTLTGTDVNGCINQDTIGILVNPLPAVFVQANSNGNFVCEGESLILSGSGAQSYTWNNNVQDGVAFVPPAGTTIYIVTGVNANACYNYDSIAITVNPLPVIGINASGNNLCDGDSLTLSASGAQSYVWSNGVVNGVSFVPSVGTSTYYISATDANNCVNTDSIAINVNSLPNVLANSSGNNICDGFTVVLNGSGAQTYTWNNNVIDGVPFVSPLGTTNYVVTGIDANGCTNQADIDILVNPLPPVAVVANTNGNSLCDGASITLSGSGAQSYTWNNGVQDGIPFVPPVGTTTYVVTGVNLNACYNYDSIQITINPLPSVTAHLSANNVCDGDSITLSCSNLAFHSWNYNVTDGVPFIAAVGVTTYILTGYDTNGCSNLDSIDVNVNPLPNVQAQSTGNQVCAGNTVALFGSGALNYTWNNGVQNAIPFVPPIGISNYTVTGTDINGCSNVDDIAIQTNNLPVINPVSSDNNVCEGESVVLIGAGAQSYTWNNGVTNGVAFIPAVGVNEYIVTGIDANACSSSDTIEVTVNPLPNVMANATSTSVCVGEEVTIFGSGAISFNWSNGINDGDIVIPVLGSNVYTVTGTDINGCLNSDTIIVMSNGLAELHEMNDIEGCDLAYADLISNSSNISAYQWGSIENGVAVSLINSIDFIGVQTNHLHVSDLSQSVNHTFFVELTGTCGNIIYDTVEVVAHQAPIIDALKDTSLCIHENNEIFADLEGFNFTWNEGTTGQYLNPSYSGMYYVSFEEHGTTCILSDTLYIEMEDCIDACVLVAPSGFSPNNDGRNDGFRAIHTCEEGISYFDMKIFDRWGGLVFQTSDPEAAWDGFYKGEKAPIATYGFVIDYMKAYDTEKAMLSGNVSLIR